MIYRKSRRSMYHEMIAWCIVVSPLSTLSFQLPSPNFHPSRESRPAVLGCTHPTDSFQFRGDFSPGSRNGNFQSLTQTRSTALLHSSPDEILGRKTTLQSNNFTASGSTLNVTGQCSFIELTSFGVVDVVALKEQNRGVHHQKKIESESRISKSSRPSKDNINISSRNPALTDPSFLRRRTTLILKITSDSRDSRSNHNESGMKADKKTFDWLIDAWGRSNAKDATEMALTLLDRMEKLNEVSPDNKKKFEITPDVKSYTKVISCIARSGRRNAGEQAELILSRMIAKNIKPNTYTYTSVTDAYARSPSIQSPYHAQRLVDTMEELRSKGDPDVRPTARAWNSVIGAWGQWCDSQNNISGATRAEACLDIMEDLAIATGNEEVRPNCYNYNSVISAWANSKGKGTASRAEKILEKMEKLYETTGDDKIKPRTATYNAIIDAWAKSGEMDAANRAELLLGHMLELFQTGQNVDAAPNVRSFNSVLNAWAKSENEIALERATEVLTSMEALDVSPDVTSFSTLINAHARSNTFGKAQAAYSLFLHMKHMYEATGNESLRPNNVIYNSVLNACAFTVGDLEEQSKAIEIANSMLVGLNESSYGNPDQVTYGSYLKVLVNQMQPGKARSQLAEAVFLKCSRNGMVGEFVLSQFREVALESTYKKLFRKSFGEELGLGDLPSSWTRNVIEGKKMRQRHFRKNGCYGSSSAEQLLNA